MSTPTGEDPIDETAGRSRVASVTAALAIVAVLSAGLVDGVHVERLWVVGVATVVIAILERHPVTVTAGRSGRLYFDVPEIGIGLIAASASPAALGLVTAVAFLPMLCWGRYSAWKRVFAIGQVVLGAVAVGVVVEAVGRDEIGFATAAAAGVAYFAATSLPLLAMLTALHDPALRRETLTTAPATIVGSVCALALGFLLGPPLHASTDMSLLTLAAVAGVVIAVRASHLAAMRADRMRVLFTAAAGLGRAGEPTDLDRLLADLGPLLVPGTTGLNLVRLPPSDGGASVPVRSGEWLVADMGPAADPPRREDLERLELLATVVADVLDQQERVAEVSHAASTDPLTGLLNRRGLDDAMRAVRQTATIAMVDLDRLKVINDTHGHAAGDAALIAIASSLLAGLRSTDIAARTGGDEFVVVLPGIPAEEARDVLERMLSHLAAAPGIPDGVTVSATVGLATWAPDGGSSWSDVVETADAQLYARRFDARGGGTPSE